MHLIQETPYGLRLTFNGFIQADEMKEWFEESKKVLTALKAKKPQFAVLINMMQLKPLPQDSKVIMGEGQKLYREMGMTRSAVIVDSVMTKIQFKSIAQASGIYEYERYIDVVTNKEDWPQVAMRWLEKGIDPDVK